MKDFMKRVLIVAAVLIGMGLAAQATKSLFGSTDTHGYVMSQDAFNSSCVPEAVKNGNTKEVATSYCSCVFTEAVAKYGGEKFTKMMTESPDDLSPYNDIINQCAIKARG